MVGLAWRKAQRFRQFRLFCQSDHHGLSQALLDELTSRRTPLIEDACESHGTTFRGRKIGTFGLASNFSFYYAHHLSTVEGGMISTDDSDFYECVRMFRSHGLVRESTS